MKKYLIAFVLIFVWFIIVLGFTTNTLLGNKVIYFIVTIPLLAIPAEIIKRFVYKKYDKP